MPALATRSRLPRPDDPDIIQRVASAVERGHPIETAGKLAGLGLTVAWDWLKRGTEDIEAAPPGTPVEELGSHAKFASAVKDAEARFVDAKLGIVNRCAEDGSSKAWLPAMTLLERRRPRDFGRNDRMEIDQRSLLINVTVTDAVSGPTLAKLLALAQRELQAGGEGTTEPHLYIEAPASTPTDVT